MAADATALWYRLIAAAVAAGFQPAGGDAELTGTRRAVVASWPLGQRVVEQRFQLALDAASHSITLREAVYERTVGLRPPSWFLGIWRQHGFDYREHRAESGHWGSGSVEFGPLRKALGQLADEAGWSFRYCPLALPTSDREEARS